MSTNFFSAPPPPPTDLKIVDMTDKTVSLEWTAPSNIEPNQFNGYFVERSPEGTDKWIKCNDVPIRKSYYKVQSINNCFASDFLVKRGCASCVILCA